MMLWAVILSGAAALTAATPIPCVCSGNRTECSDHAKTSISPSDICPASTVLIFCDNAITSLPQDLPDGVEELDLARNRIAVADTELRSLGRLRTLDVSVNSLQHLRFLPEPCGLTRLIASSNRIASLDGPLRSCSALEELWLSGNSLGTLPDGAFAALGNLRALSLSKNALRAVTSGTFRGLHHLVTLELLGTEIQSLSDGTFSGLGELRTLDLDENHLQFISRGTLRGLSALTDLHLCDNHIASLAVDTFAETRLLTDLFLDSNDLRSLPVAALEGLPLKSLWVRSNALERIPLLRGCCAQLRVAAFDWNRAQEVGEAEVRALLRPGVERASLEGNPLRAQALAWAARAQDVELRADDEVCRCGALALRAQPDPESVAVTLCVDMECGEGKRWANWVEAVRVAAANSV